MKHRDFKLLLEAGIVTEVVSSPNPSGKGWCLNVRTARPVLDGFRGDLESDRSAWRKFRPRRFGSLDTVASYLRGLGLDGFRVEVLNSGEDEGEAP